jgi:glutamyl-tRNA synthetase
MTAEQRWSEIVAAAASRGRCGRYAPSPTGPLHLGNLRTALLAWLQARLAGGAFILRVEDLDAERSRPEFAQGLLDDLRWLGLDWDEGPDVGGAFGPYVQSERSELYQAALDLLDSRGQLFRCACSRRELREAAANAPHDRAQVYSGRCLRSPPPPSAKTALRWRVPLAYVEIHDVIMGRYGHRLDEHVGDLIVQRSDKLFAYQLAVVVDDALMGVSDVLRGEDLLDSAPRQYALHHALGFTPPTFWHVALMRDASGARLSKRDRSTSLAALRDQGATPPQLVGQLATSAGLLERYEPISAAELRDELSSERLVTALRAASSQYADPFM